MREVVHVGGDARHHGGGADEGVVERDQWRQVGDLEQKVVVKQDVQGNMFYLKGGYIAQR